MSGRALTLFILGRFVQQEERDSVQNVATAIAGPMGVEVLEIKWLGSGRTRSVRLVVDQEGGVGADTCARLSREFDLEWEARTATPRDFALEITSPGPDRPLRTVKDFLRVVNRWVQIERQSDAGTDALTGKVVSCSEDTLVLSETGIFPDAGDLSGCVAVPFAEIRNAKILFVIGNTTPRGKMARRTTRR